MSQLAQHLVSAIEVVANEPVGLVERFEHLAEQWRTETLVSSVQDTILNPAYQQIIGMGEPALPLILQDLRRQTDHWFWALYAITGQDAASTAQSVSEAARAWLQWGAERGLVNQ